MAVPVVAGFLVSFLGQKELLTWYRGLNKPRWQPPAFLFGMVPDATPYVSGHKPILCRFRTSSIGPH